jgi:voltage-gated potassium channel Kch
MFKDRPLLERIYQRLTLPRALAIVMCAAVTLVVSASIFMRLAEPETFPTIGVALWWAVVTVGTVGYGDVVPRSAAGRGVAALVIIFGMAWIPVVASLIVAALVNRFQSARQVKTRSDLAHIEERLSRIEDALARLEGRGAPPST